MAKQLKFDEEARRALEAGVNKLADEKESVSARDSFGGGGGSRPNSLAQSSQLVGVGGVPSCLVAGISTELAIFEEFTSGGVEH